MAAAVASIPQPTKQVDAVLNYYRVPEDGTIDPFYDGTVIETRRKDVEVPVSITDLRGFENDTSLDQQGFQLVSHSSIEKDFDDEERIKDVYYKECADLLKKTTGATRVHVISHIVRRKSHEEAMQDEQGLDDMAPVPKPSTGRVVHVDQSYNGAKAVLDLCLPDESEQLSRSRWAFINVWRAIEPVNREPLCLTDARSVAEEDLQERELCLNPKDAGDDGARFFMWSVKPPAQANQHQWYYFSKMTPEEVLLFKIYDSKLVGTARRTPHTAFESPEDSGPPRQSLELRCLVFWEDQ